MGNQITKPQEVDRSQQGARGGHEKAVLEAMTTKERALTLMVLVLNLSLGAWLIRDADFSAMKPNGQSESSAALPPANDGMASDHLIAASAP